MNPSDQERNMRDQNGKSSCAPRVELFTHILDLFQGRKRETLDCYAEIKLRIPSYLKNATIDQLTELGAVIDQDVIIPQHTDCYFRKLSRLKGKMIEIKDNHIDDVKKYFHDTRKRIPESLREKRVSDVTDEEWNLLGIDMVKFRSVIIDN